MSRHFYLQYTRMVLVGSDNFPNCFLNILIFVKLGDIFWFYSTTFFNNVNLIAPLKFSVSFLSLDITLFSSICVVSLFSKDPLFVRNGLMKVQNFLFAVMPFFVTLLRKDFMFFLLRETHKLRCLK